MTADLSNAACAHRLRCRKLAPAALLLACLSLAAGPASAAAGPEDEPLSPAQTALFETPHLKNVERPETLLYSFVRDAPDGFTDRVELHVDEIHADGTKSVSFDFLTGAHHVFFPAVDKFSGNPLLMLFLEHDVQEMKQEIGVAAAYFRNRIRAAFVDRATVSETTFARAGTDLPARKITLRPFADDPRFRKLPQVQQKLYSFVLADRVPGGLAELGAEMPADAANGLPAISERITFSGERP